MKTTAEIFRQYNLQVAQEKDDLPDKISRVEGFNIWMEKIKNKYRGEFKQMCHARAKVAAN